MSFSSQPLIKKITTAQELQICQSIRHQVFIVGQNVPIDEEIDGLDPIAEHYLLLLDQTPVGTARVRYIDDFAKIERVAILDEHQGKGLGYALMNFIIIDIAKNPAIKKAKLGAQTYAIPFYERLGFSVYGDEYLDAGIMHKIMVLNF